MLDIQSAERETQKLMLAKFPGSEIRFRKASPILMGGHFFCVLKAELKMGEETRRVRVQVHGEERKATECDLEPF